VRVTALLYDVEEGVLKFLGDRAARALPDFVMVHRADRRDLRRRAGKKELVGDVEHLAREGLLLDFVAALLGQRDDRIARDAVEDRGVGRGGVDRAVFDEKEVLAAPLRELAVHRQHDALGHAVFVGVHLHQRGIEVVAGGFGGGRVRIGRRALPRGDFHVHALRDSLFAQVRAPFPDGDKGVDLVFERVYAHRPHAAKDHRAQIAGRQSAVFDGAQ
jgi:hypothetical protein